MQAIGRGKFDCERHSGAGILDFGSRRVRQSENRCCALTNGAGSSDAGRAMCHLHEKKGGQRSRFRESIQARLPKGHKRLRRQLCGKIEIARLPDVAGSEKYDVSVASIVALLRDGEGLPWNRIQRLSCYAGVPLPASLQWHLVCDALDQVSALRTITCCGWGAQGELIHNDDTSMCVLALEKKLKSQEPLIELDPDRRGVFTTGILSRADRRPTIALFFTGPHHSGENLGELLSKRQSELPPPIQMCDALSRNMPKVLNAIVANCLIHGRRNFVDVVKAFPTEVQYVLEHLKTVYKIDAEAKEQGLSPDARLQRHQEQIGPGDGRTASLVEAAIRRQEGGAEFVVGRRDLVHAEALGETHSVPARCRRAARQ